jgi:hypothetical protein
METICKNCQHFRAKGTMVSNNMWGFLRQIQEENTTNNKESPFFRWGDDTCADFKAKEGLKDLQNSKKHTVH